MRDRRDRTSWVYQIPPNLAPPTSHAESGTVMTCHPPSSSHLPSGPISHPLLPSLHFNQPAQHRLLTASSQPVPSLSSFNVVSFSPPERPDDQNQQPVQQLHQQRSQHYLSRQLAPLPPSFTMMTETWFGLVQTPRDAYLLLEACRLGMLYRITRRLTDLERSQIIRPGAVFVWEEKEAGIKRWTDHVRWSPSRVSGAFLIYSELLSASTRDSHPNASDPLLKQSFSSTTLDGDRLHLIAYYSKAALDSGQLPTPTGDERLRSIIVPPGVYPDHRAIGGIEDQSSRERQRTNLLPRSSVTSLETSHSLPSANSLESATSSLDTPQLQPATPTHLGDVSYSRPNPSGLPSLPPSRSVSCPKNSHDLKYSTQTSYFSGSLYHMGQGLVDSQVLAEPNRWSAFQQSISEWDTTAPGSAAPAESSSYSVTSPPNLLAPGTPLPSLGVWQAEQEREKSERRFSAPAAQDPTNNVTHLSTGANHTYHPYAKPLDRERIHKERRMDGKVQREPRVISYETSTAPATPLSRPYTLPSIQNNNSNNVISSSYGQMAPPMTSTSTSPGPLTCRTPALAQSQKHSPSTYQMMSPQFSSAQPTPVLYSFQVSSSHHDISSYQPFDSNRVTSPLLSRAYHSNRPSSPLEKKSASDSEHTSSKKEGDLEENLKSCQTQRPSSSSSEFSSLPMIPPSAQKCENNDHLFSAADNPV
ncbi:hypothetical protein O181_001595 [Austropuccinia psidii MF-1]|uniref:Uncharacterized protein n=1 Tax=Austropuccinia psidii MF-1 TaxID=1389203 RepID=A0A9Q3BBA6_9BASI|nr:hypothetical protein [Austropuccinia psidii MF-1]